MKNNIKNYIYDILSIIIGGFLWAVSINTFTKPNMLAPGGFSGIATVINYFFNFIPIGVCMLVLNIPLFILSYKKYGKKFILITAVAMVLTSVIIDVSQLFLPVYVGDKFLASVFGGLLAGVGLGIIYLRGIATGGVDVLARIIERFIGFISYGKLIICLDIIVIIIAGIAFKDLAVGMYSAISAYVSGLIVDKILSGAEQARLVFVISEKYSDIQEKIIGILHRGVTILNAKGGYTGSNRNVVMAVCRYYELAKIKKIIYSIDDSAFVIIADAGEVRGKGFKKIGDNE